jgi:hypothetical protein
MRELTIGEPRAVAPGIEDDPGAAVQSERADDIAGRELEGVRVAGEVAREALALNRGEAERQRPHAQAAARCGGWRPAPTSAA